MHSRIAFVAALASVVRGQQVGTYQTETHPSLSWSRCTASKSCTSVAGKVVIDSNWRWTHKVGDYTNCYTGNTWDTSLCPSNAQGGTNCALEGADYAKTYGATTSGNALTLKFVTKHDFGTNIGSRLYLMDSSDTAYQQFNLLNSEFTFDVDVSKLPCGLNGALYFVSMDKDGGSGRYSNNKAGAKYGTGYCDGQCPRDLKFINGEANCQGWKPSSNDANAGVGDHGSCCAEMDVWEANSISSAVTPHSCDTTGQTRCNGDSCGGTYSATRYAGTCDPDGCDFNSYRLGNKTFYGKGKTVDTSQKFTVVTQFIGNPLTEIKRFYIQNNKLIPNSKSNIAGVSGNSITPQFCDQTKAAFNDVDPFKTHGGFSSMSKAMGAGMTLVMSIWDDHYANMLWLDSTYPTSKTAPGGPRGECPTSSGVPADVEGSSPDSQVIFSNIKFGPIGSTFTAT